MLNCVFCKSERVISYGKRYCKAGVHQLYLCKSCGKRFSSNTTFKKMKNRAEAITLALDLYYKGLSLRKVCDHLKNFYGVRVTHPTILNWIRKYVETIKNYTDRMKITPYKWNVDETAIPMRKGTSWAWDIIDRKSRFLVALKLTSFRHTNFDRNIFTESKRFVKAQPEIIISDGYAGYSGMIKKTFPKSEHVRAIGLADSKKIQFIESHHSLFKDRYKVMRGFKGIRTGQTILDGWKIYYNFVRPHSSLDGQSPAQAAGIHIPDVSNRWLWLIERGVKNQKR